MNTIDISPLLLMIKRIDERLENLESKIQKLESKLQNLESKSESDITRCEYCNKPASAGSFDIGGGIVVNCCPKHIIYGASMAPFQLSC